MAKKRTVAAAAPSPSTKPSPQSPSSATKSSSRAARPAGPPPVKGYLHGFTQKEQQRLYHQARFMEHRVHEGLPLQRAKRLLEVGCGVGAQTEILLRRFPELHVTGVDMSKANLSRAKEHLRRQPWAAGRHDLQIADVI